MKITLLQTVEQPIVYPIGTVEVIALNDIASRGAYETAHHEDEEGGIIKSVWKFPAGSQVDIPDRAANMLIGLGYAEAIPA